LQEALDEFERVVRRAEECWRGCFEEHKNEVVALAIEIAERIVRKVCAEDREVIRRTVEEALRLAKDRQSIALRLHPKDIEFVKEFEEDLLSRFEDIRSFRVEVDERVDRGGVWVETASGMIDARIRTQLDELMEAVLPDEENPWKRGEASALARVDPEPHEEPADCKEGLEEGENPQAVERDGGE
jgi:flagellar assembly protein FliH